MQLESFVDRFIDVPQGNVDGPCRQICTRMKEGFKRTNGWLVYARARETEESKVIGDRVLPRVVQDSVVGALLVTGSQWRATPGGDRGGSRAQVNVLATHKAFEGRGVARAMWQALMKRLSIDSESFGHKLRLVVDGGSCLNTDEKRQFYRRRGFVVGQAEGGLCATAVYKNGQIRRNV